MPNTTIHLALQTIATPPRWRRPNDWSLPLILLGCVLPDIPWILQRVSRQALIYIRASPDLLCDPLCGDPIYYDLRLYFGVQGSLFFCGLLALGLAFMTSRPKRTFLLLGWCALLHLLLDAVQIKWANGVLLLAPLDWQLVRFDLAWPESSLTDLASILGLMMLPLIGWLSLRRPPKIGLVSSRRWPASALVLCFWISAPLLFMDSLRDTDAYSIASLTEPALGQSVELGTAKVFARDGHLWARTMSDQELVLDSALAPSLELSGSLSGETRITPGKFSLRGTLEKATMPASAGGTLGAHERLVLHVADYHQHRKSLREILSAIGLAFVGLLWATLLWRTRASEMPHSRR